jgi:hypothetical protein
MIGHKMILIKNVVVVACQTRKELCFLSVALDLNSQPSSHNYYHHQDLTLLLSALSTLQCAHRVRGS